MSSSVRKPVRAATLVDVGRAAGVSAMAVSAVLNGAKTSSRIAPETRTRILKAAALLQYRPNAAARALAQRRMNTLGVAAVINDGGELDHYFLEVFNGVITAAALHHQNTTVFALHNWDRDAARIPGFCDGRIDGLILIGPVLGHESSNLFPPHTPFVALHANSPLPGVVNIESDEETGAYEIVRHLIAHGHQRILHISGGRGLTGAERRIRGWRRAFASVHLPCDDRWLVEGTFSVEGGRCALRSWLDRSVGELMPQAIFCASDAIAVGCLEVLAEARLRVPADISVVGFDDTQAARATIPQLTTVRQPLRAMGMRAVDTLLERIRHHHGHGELPTRGTIVFPAEIVVRASVAAPAPNRPVLALPTVAASP